MVNTSGELLKAMHVLPRADLSLHRIFSKRDLAERESASHLIAILICPFPFGYYDFLILQSCTYGIFEVPNKLKVFTTDTGIHILTYLLKSYKLKST